MNDNCSICLDPLLTENQDIYTLQCNPKHKFHRSCITTWLRTNSTCPLCRTNIQPDPIYVDDEIITEDRRQQIIELGKTVINGIASLAEQVFPNFLEGFTEDLDQSVTSGDYDDLLNEMTDCNTSENNQLSPELRIFGRMFIQGLASNISRNLESQN